MPVTLLLDNGSSRPESTLNLRRLAAVLGERVGQTVHPVSLLHANRVPADALGGRKAHTFEPFLRRQVQAGVRDFLVLPLFFGPSAALTGFIPETVETLQAEHGPFDLRLAEVLRPLPEGEPRLVRILLDNLAQAWGGAAPAGHRVVLVDHGSPLPAVTAVRRWLARRMAEALPGTELLEAVMERRPGPESDFNGPLLAEVLGRLGAEDPATPVALSMLFLRRPARRRRGRRRGGLPGRRGGAPGASGACLPAGGRPPRDRRLAGGALARGGLTLGDRARPGRYPSARGRAGPARCRPPKRPARPARRAPPFHDVRPACRDSADAPRNRPPARRPCPEAAPGGAARRPARAPRLHHGVGQHTLDALARCPDLELTAAFGPQHGMRGDKQDNMVETDDYPRSASRHPGLQPLRRGALPDRRDAGQLRRAAGGSAGHRHPHLHLRDDPRLPDRGLRRARQGALGAGPTQPRRTPDRGQHPGAGLGELRRRRAADHASRPDPRRAGPVARRLQRRLDLDLQVVAMERLSIPTRAPATAGP